MSKQGSFNSKVGVVLAAAGSAVGLGNIWKFPYMVGENGGSAFLLVYMLCCLLIGLPIMVAEFSIGKRAGVGIYNAYHTLTGNKRWQWMGAMGFVVSLLLLSFYSVVTGWCLEYLFDSVTGHINNSNPEELSQFFGSFVGSVRPIIWGLISLWLTAAISWFGVKSGIERMSKLLMPLLLVLLFLLIVRALMMPGSDIGMRFLFMPDFSKINPTVVLNAMGQAFFSLSVGMGVILTYGSYMPKSQDIMATSLQVTVLDTLVAILAGLAIFPAVFAMGVSPTEGPQLVYVILPTVFDQMSGGMFWASLFFLLLALAAVTSLLSMLELPVSYLMDWLHLTRRKAIALLLILLSISMAACAYSMTGKAPWLCPMGYSLFDCFDTLTSKIFMPLGGLAMTIFVGWVCPRHDTEDELNRHSRVHAKWAYDLFFFLIRFVIPVAILIIFADGLDIF